MDGALSLPEGGDLLETTQDGTGRRGAGTVSAGAGHRMRAERKGLSRPLEMGHMRVWLQENQEGFSVNHGQPDRRRGLCSELEEALRWPRGRQPRRRLPYVLHLMGDFRAFRG